MSADSQRDRRYAHAVSGRRGELGFAEGDVNEEVVAEGHREMSQPNRRTVSPQPRPYLILVPTSVPTFR